MPTTAFADVLKYIDQYWDAVTYTPGQKIKAGWRNSIMRIGTIPLPNPYVAPNNQYFAGMQFYWDSYFTVVGLIRSNKGDLARGMVDNLCYLYSQYKYIPARNSRTSTGRTQPPLLTRMAWELYEAGVVNDEWMARVMAIAQAEYETVWTKGRRHDKRTGLSCYRPRFFRRWLTVYESGWDKSSRFVGVRKLIPVDLNAMLFQYEQDFYDWAVRHDADSAPLWQERMTKRLAAMDQYLWDPETGFYYDYNLGRHRREKLRTLAGFTPLWCGASSAEQAEATLRQLPTFEHELGLANTEKLSSKGKQWDFPNGWPPLQCFVVHGLRRYGYNTQAARLTHKWLTSNEATLIKSGYLWEKYDVVNSGPGRPGGYPTQPGFSWTCGAFLWLLHDLED